MTNFVDLVLASPLTHCKWRPKSDCTGRFPTTFTFIDLLDPKTIEWGGRVALLNLVLELTSVRNLGHVTKLWCIRYVYQGEISSKTKKKYWNKRRYIKTKLQRYLTDLHNIHIHQFIDVSSEFLWKIHWKSRKWGKGVFFILDTSNWCTFHCSFLRESLIVALWATTRSVHCRKITIE